MVLCAQLSPDEVIHVWTDIGVVFRLDVDGQAKVEHTECLDSTSYVAWAAFNESSCFPLVTRIHYGYAFSFEKSRHVLWKWLPAKYPMMRWYMCFVEVGYELFRIPLRPCIMNG
jgi:hypothetical protein